MGKNLLLGYGETLTSPVDRKGSPNNKVHPYSYDEAKERLLHQQEVLINRLRKVSHEAVPSDWYVAKFTLHPAYLAKSYYPSNILRGSGLVDVGSRSVLITPEKTQRKGDPYEELSNCMYIAGKESNFLKFYDRLYKDGLNKAESEQIIRFERVDYFEPLEKIKSTTEEPMQLLDVALHTPSGSASRLVDYFCEYVEKINGKVDKERALHCGGLTFLPVSVPLQSIHAVAEFTFLRVLRRMPMLRSNEPSVFRNTGNGQKFDIPTQSAVNAEVNVAVFDGGLGVADLEGYCSDIQYNTSAAPVTDLLHHGNEVTSTILFGNIKDGQTELPTPICNLDHYRVVDSGTNGSDPDLYDVLARIQSGLKTKKYDFVNLSLGPRFPIEDDEVNPWTALLDEYVSLSGSLITVAVGNDGRLSSPYNRIQPPSDMVNSLAIGSANSESHEEWGRADYSCVGPGRSPGYIKPDAVCFGGSENEPFKVYSPIARGVSETAGTSYAAPLALRSAIKLYTDIETLESPVAAKALLIHNCDQGEQEKSEIGWGRVVTDTDTIIECADNEATIIYQGTLEPGKITRADIPYPSDIEINGKVTIKATLCYISELDPEHPGNYTRSGLSILFRKSAAKTHSFFKLKNQYESEQEARTDAHKWETTMQASHTFMKNSLESPCFEIDYQLREQSQAVNNKDYGPLPYALVITVSANNTPELYNAIRQRYQTLQPVKLRSSVEIEV